MRKLNEYPFEIRPLSADEGGGFLISYSDFSDCISDGETVEEALANGKDALKSTIAALKAKDFPIPVPNGGGVASGKFVARVPKTVHAIHPLPQSTSEAKSASRDLSPRASITWPECGQPLKRSTA